MTESLNVAGTRRGMSELVDGTIRVKIDIDPMHRADFLRLFPEIDMPVALTPLTKNYQQNQQDSPPLSEKREPSPSNIAALLGKEWGFWRWLTVNYGKKWEQYCEPVPEFPQEWDQGDNDAAEDAAKHCIYEIVGINSRAELDTDAKALTRFETIVRVPYRRWMVLGA
jgi:hypothetical protein